jgi:hypothetical protein
MSTELGILKSTGSREVNLYVTRYWGGKKGVCVQLTAVQEDNTHGYVQLSCSDILALLPILKEHIINVEMSRKKAECEEAIKESKALEKTIVSDMRDVAELMIHSHSYDITNLLLYGKREFEKSEELVDEENIIPKNLI